MPELKHTTVETTIHLVTAVVELQPPHSFPPGSSHTCIPPLPSLFSPGLWLPHSAGARPQCEPWMGRSGSRGTCGAGRPSWWRDLRTLPRMERTGSCTGRNTACCAPSPCCIRVLSHAVGMAEMVEMFLLSWFKHFALALLQQILPHSLRELYGWTRICCTGTKKQSFLLMLPSVCKLNVSFILTDRAS